jgi:O-antigen/teichoic acid export membrane protein
MTKIQDSALGSGGSASEATREAVAEVAAYGPDAPEGMGRALVARLSNLLSLRKSQSGKDAFRASAWSAVGYGVTTALRFVSRLVLAKLLTNAAPMGDVALVVVVLSGLEMISDLGIGVGIVQHRNADDPTYQGTAFSVQAVRGVALWAIASLLALPVAKIYHEPALTGLLLFAALSTLFKAIANPQMWLFTRRMDLRRPTLLTIGSEVFGFGVTVVWTILSPSAWAIVGGTIAAAACFAAGSHILAPSARFTWNRKIAKEIVQFGGWMLVSSATYFLSSRGENLMLKGAISDAEFGCFAFASMLVTTPVTAFNQLAAQVYFPMLASSLREDPDRAARHFQRGKWMFTGIALCFVWGAVFVGPPIVGLMKLRSTFAGLAWMVPLLGLRAGFDIFGAPTSFALLAAGQSRYASWANLIRLTVLIVGLYATLAAWGLHGAIWVLVGAPLLSYFAYLPGLRIRIKNSLRVELANLLVFWIGAAAALVIHFSMTAAP